MSSSSSMSSSSFAKRTMGHPLCCYGVKATLKFSTTAKNPGRPFLGCPKYNTEGLPFCKFLQWADSNQREKDLSKIVDLLKKRKIDLRKMVDQLEKELLRQTQEPDIKWEQKLGKQFSGIALVVLLICIGRWLLY
ncbi:hypothetical protein I3842_15G113000 [Carya illinoinensis]|uniref:GRF-type domain-containing protein n=1 Tax=Carya illinoinensis TaxID=32201 RepID=A0A922A5W7_CARIL|nr:hypothetical protein I3842_15G113000 [Carya illinoinensis]